MPLIGVACRSCQNPPMFPFHENLFWKTSIWKQRHERLANHEWNDGTKASVTLIYKHESTFTTWVACFPAVFIFNDITWAPFLEEIYGYQDISLRRGNNSPSIFVIQILPASTVLWRIRKLIKTLQPFEDQPNSDHFQCLYCKTCHCDKSVTKLQIDVMTYRKSSVKRPEGKGGGLTERGLIRERGLFTKSYEKEIFDSF